MFPGSVGDGRSAAIFARAIRALPSLRYTLRVGGAGAPAAAAAAKCTGAVSSVEGPATSVEMGTAEVLSQREGSGSLFLRSAKRRAAETGM